MTNKTVIQSVSEESELANRNNMGEPQEGNKKKVKKPWLEKPSVPWRIRDVGLVLLFTIAVPLVLSVIWILLSKYFGNKIGFLQNQTLGDGLIEIATLITEISLVIWLLKKYHAKISTLGLNNFSWWRFILWVIGGILFLSISVILIFSLVQWLVPSFDANEAQDVALQYGANGVGLWLSFIAAVIIAPIVEEIYFRGLILPVLMRRFGAFFGILTTSILFALMHFQPNVVLYTFVLAILLAIVRLRLKSVIPSMLLHAINNFIAFSIIVGWLH
jgi:membrane protease YdiL (CAAX protease family)